MACSCSYLASSFFGRSFLQPNIPCCPTRIAPNRPIHGPSTLLNPYTAGAFDSETFTPMRAVPAGASPMLPWLINAGFIVSGSTVYKPVLSPSIQVTIGPLSGRGSTA